MGALLVERLTASPAEVRFGPVTIHARDSSEEAWQVIDGQQRVTALVGALLHPQERPITDRFALWFDLEHEAFHRREKSEVPDTWVPLSAMRSRVNFMRFLAASPLEEQHPDLLQRAFELSDRILEYRIPVYVVRTGSDTEARLIFKRTNTAGVEMKEHEVFDAIAGPGPKPIASLANHLETLGFGRLAEDWLLRAHIAVTRGAARSPSSENELPSSVEETSSALEAATRFLAVECGVPHLKLLPYRFPLIILARFFHVHPSAPPRARLLLRRWFWRGALSGRHGDSSRAGTQRALDAVTSDIWESVERLLALAPRAFDYPDPLTSGWASNGAIPKLVLLAQWHQVGRAGGWPEGRAEELLLDFDDDKGIAQLTHRLSAENTTASRVVAVAPSLESFAELPPQTLDALGLSLPLTEQLDEDSPEAWAAWQKSLQTFCHAFFRERAEPEASDRPPIEVLVGTHA